MPQFVKVIIAMIVMIVIVVVVIINITCFFFFSISIFESCQWSLDPMAFPCPINRGG